LPSEYSSESCGASGNFNNHTANSSSASNNNNNNNINTSGYSTNHSRYDSLAPETPYNSIVVQLSKKLEICEIDDDKEYHARITSSPIPIKRISKCDESAPILSGGASIIDFTPQAKCDSPSVRRKTDSCPIVSGGSLDLIDDPPPPKTVKSVNDRDKNSFSWIVDLKEDLKIVEEISEVKEQQKTATPKNSLGFYVDFGSLESKPEEKLIRKLARSEDGSAKKGTGFYVDFSDSSCPNTPKQTTRVPSTSSVIVEPKKSEAVEGGRDKKNFFNMYIDLSDSKDNDSSLEVEERKEEEEAAVMSSSSGSKKGCFMFIESDASPLVVRHRAKIASREPGKRHSWNVNQTSEYEAEMKASSARKYQRSTSVNIPDKDLHEKSSIINVPSKTSSLSIGSSLSPHEDFSCSKSLSSRSNLSISTSNTSIDQSETKVQEKAAVRRRRREAKINETYDKSSQGSVTDEIFSNHESPSSSTDTDDVTFQNQLDDDATPCIQSKEATLIEDLKNKMDTIVERSEHSSPFKKAIVAVEPIVESTNNLPCHTMESLQQLIEKQKQILENTDSTSTSFVKLSDLDKPAPLPPANATSNNRKDYPFMTNSAGFRVSLLENQNNHKGHQNMSRSTGNNFANLASSVENSKSLSRLFPHLSKGELFALYINSNIINNSHLNSIQ
jgi:BTB/POZ domain-containing protein 8